MDAKEALATAVKLLSRREHGCYELQRKLIAKGSSVADAEQAVQYCMDNNYLNDLRYAQNQVRLHISKGHGASRIRQALSLKHVAQSTISQALDMQQADWFELAREVARRKFKGKVAADRQEYAKQVRFLQYRGFDVEQIKYALANLD